MESSPPSRLRIWFLATRPRTLPAAVAPVLAGSALAWHDGAFIWPATLSCLLFALLIQIGTNFANDYYDFIKGADTAERVGPRRAVAAGLVKPHIMKLAMVLVFALAFAVGLTLLKYGGWPLLAIGVTSIVCGVAYTGGPYPLGYNGLGDIFVFVFFGLVAVCSTYFVQAGRIGIDAPVVATGIGALAANILVVNNYRDVETDAKPRFCPPAICGVAGHGFAGAGCPARSRFFLLGVAAGHLASHGLDARASPEQGGFAG
jgi:1,4-dihydroxy-2-naphthoate polyprenyltransferase